MIVELRREFGLLVRATVDQTKYRLMMGVRSMGCCKTPRQRDTGLFNLDLEDIRKILGLEGHENLDAVRVLRTS